MVGLNQQSTTTGLSSGYHCVTCGVWVVYGATHDCLGKQQQQHVQPFAWSWSYPPQISSFKGAVKTFDDLPTNAATGDGFYIEKDEALVVRQSGGWFHFDRR
jgi:hypothetical protein